MIHEIAYASTFHDNTCTFLLKTVAGHCNIWPDLFYGWNYKIFLLKSVDAGVHSRL